MRTALISIFILLFFYSASIGQSNNKYEDIDGLLESNSMIDALDAIKKLKESYKKDTSDSQYWVRLSKASYNIYNYEDAKTSIDKAIKLSPNNSEFYFEKGLLYNKIGDLTNALSPLEKAVNIKPVGKYFYWKGIINQQLNKIEDAENDYQNAILQKFESPELYNNFAILLSEKGKYAKALNAINKALKLDNKYAEAYSARSKINFCLLNVDSACADKNRASQLGYYKAFEIPDSICNGTLTQKLQYNAEFFVFNK